MPCNEWIMKSIKNVIQNHYGVCCVKYHISALTQNKTISFFLSNKVKPYFYPIMDEQTGLRL